jgi:hypothetical protein
LLNGTPQISFLIQKKMYTTHVEMKILVKSLLYVIPVLENSFKFTKDFTNLYSVDRYQLRIRRHLFRVSKH